MIDVKQAVEIVRAYARDLFPGDQMPGTPTLEEVELTEDGTHWLITMGVPGEGPLAALNPTVKFKVFKVDANSGRVQSMKIREVA